jgi:hypothetical protein
MKYLMLVTISLPVALSGTLALAHGPGTAGGMMGHGMQGCMPMMQGMSGGGGQRPNQQWRRGQVGPGSEKLSPGSRHRSSE